MRDDESNPVRFSEPKSPAERIAFLEELREQVRRNTDALRNNYLIALEHDKQRKFLEGKILEAEKKKLDSLSIERDRALQKHEKALEEVRLAQLVVEQCVEACVKEALNHPPPITDGAGDMRPNPESEFMTPRAKAILALDLNTAAKWMEEKYPETWKRFNTKTIHAPGNYFSSRALAVGLTGAVEETRYIIARGDLKSNLGFAAAKLEECDFPTYYVSKSLLEAMKRSKPPKGMTWGDIRLPYPALFFMVPRGSIVEPEPIKGEVIGIGVTRFNQGEHLSIPTIGTMGIPMPETRVSVFWLIAPSALSSNDCTFPETHPLEPDPKWIDLKTEEDGRPYFGPDGSFSSYMAGLVANLILLMESRSELIERGGPVPMKGKRKPGPVLHNPTWLGRNYQILRREQSESTGMHFTELGWRCGHFKRQHFGIGRQETKTIWVDPYVAFTRGLVITSDDENHG